MTFEVITAEQAANGAIVRSDRRLFLAADEQTVVEEGDERARFLLAGPGGNIDAQHAARLGLSVVDGKIVIAGAEPAAATEVPEVKQRDEHEDKQRVPAENKGAGKKDRR